MISPLSLSQLAERCNAAVPEKDVYFSTVSTDSRHIRAGDLFVALHGDHFDGHDYLAAVEKSGACAAIVDTCSVDTGQAVSIPQLVVDNTVKALGQLGSLNRAKFKGKVIAITGSSGKTTVKEMLASILSTQGRVLATKGNLNNHIGVPLTLLSIDADHQYAVIEMGASALGEVDYLAELTQADVSVVNNVGTAHVGGFGSLQNIAKGKGEIYHHLKASGVAVINKDDVFSTQWISKTKNIKQLTYSVSSNKQADVVAADIALNKTAQAHFKLGYQQKTVDIELSLVGQHHVANALAASTCALALGIELSHIKKGLEAVQPVAGRMLVNKNSMGAVVIDDSYNANSSSMKAAIDAVAQMNGARIAVLGAMGELGEFSEALHKEVGAYAKQKGIEHLFAVGEPSLAYTKAFGDGGKYFSSKEDLINACFHVMNKQSIFLIKGSRSAGMEAVVAALMQEKQAC